MSSAASGAPGAGGDDPLATGELTVLGAVTTASNATFVCTVDDADGTPVRCVYKPVRGERPLWDFPDGTLAGREYASYLVSEALGWGVIPRTLLRDGPFGAGMVQRWIDSVDRAGGGDPDLVDLCSPSHTPPGCFEIFEAIDSAGEPISLVHADDPRLHRMAVLDVLINNADRKGGHVLEGLDGTVYGVDHGICLHTEDKLRTVLWGWAGTRVPAPLVVDVADLVSSLDGELGEQLAEHITRDEVTALGVRAVDLVEDPTMPLPYGSRRIPWPPF
ncbi:SCO1664 family protein [Rhodococcus rhodnii]|uniref:SCO1664 family protein n=2 Tax=Rhodococcus rhodnii TaxID=38312 RepID=A0A6P2CJ66_9NOCA|nr:SCO1664 family protein [Rhodococcus rhodnii]EOM78409.1 putative phosphatidylinositol 3-and 4-kinase [Rhodococcus rhodnii LMG 5362]TXG91226.1 SCO1664 family protein [Rhodococcus rhodnii]